MHKIKRKKFSIKKTLKLIIPLLIIIVLFLSRHYLITMYQSKITGYEYKTIEVFNELDIYKDIKKETYSKTLEKIISTEYYNPKYLDAYLKTDYHETDTFYNDINTLLSLGYTSNEINNIYKNLLPDSINLLVNNDCLNDINNILSLNYFHEENLERYLKYNKEKELSFEDLITYVNIGLDKAYYTNVIDIDNPDDTSVIVNKYHKLANNYVPSDLEAINKKYNRGNNNLMRHEARIHFEEMCEDALKDDITIYSGSAYRSYSYQLNLYNRYVNQDGKARADTYSARAGYSEHQTGLATDVMNKKLGYISASDEEYTWLVDNSYKYGFLLRYPKGKENITGYMYEEWHFRYVGTDIAKEIYEQNITYDEYIARAKEK